MRELIKNLKGEHTVVLSSHILSEISETCDRIMVINSGKIEWSGTESELSLELRQGARVAITVRVPNVSSEQAQAKALDVAQQVPGVSSAEGVLARESGPGVASIMVRGEGDLRDELCRALVRADLGVISLGREQELESMFLELLGETGEGAPVRRKKTRRKEGDAVDPVPVAKEGGAA
jgi:ABC-2 type transport system ATP-binding protein